MHNLYTLRYAGKLTMSPDDVCAISAGSSENDTKSNAHVRVWGIRKRFNYISRRGKDLGRQVCWCIYVGVLIVLQRIMIKSMLKMLK